MMHNHLPSPVKYREDINGLRAWAVIAVLLFHFSLIGLPGGFAGVDVFFVISGYLMTAIIVGGYEKGDFSFLKFYMSRVRRIVPALLVVIAALLVFGWFYLPTIDYKVLGTQSISAMAFVSNVYYYTWTGYFDTSAHEKWLLHTWSLAVEAQFYVLYPLLIGIFWKLTKGAVNKLLWFVIFLLLASLFANLYFLSQDQSLSFYMLPMRGWELAAGGIVYLLSRQKPLSDQIIKFFYWIGWLLVIASFVFINQSMVWPGYWAILPVLGTALIILGHNENCRLTNNAVAQWLGDRSYSLYLWHWPLVVGLYFTNTQSDWLFVVAAFSLSLLLAHLSYKFIETPTRQYLTNTGLVKEVIIIGGLTFILASLAWIIRSTHFEGRLPEVVEVAANASFDKNPRFKECLVANNESGETNPCLYGRKPVDVILIGDSHADAIATALQKSVPDGFLAWTRSCPILLGMQLRGGINNERDAACLNLPNQLIQHYTGNNEFPDVPIVILTRASKYAVGDIDGVGSASSHNSVPLIYFDEPVSSSDDKKFQQDYIDSVVKTACSFQKTRQVYLVRPIPEIGMDVPRVLSRELMFGTFDSEIKIKLEDYRQRNELVWKAQDEAVKSCGVKILSPIPYLCDNEYCYATKNGRALYSDDDHLSEYGNKLLIPMFKQIFEQQGLTK